MIRFHSRILGKGGRMHVLGGRSKVSEELQTQYLAASRWRQWETGLIFGVVIHKEPGESVAETLQEMCKVPGNTYSSVQVHSTACQPDSPMHIDQVADDCAGAQGCTATAIPWWPLQ